MVDVHQGAGSIPSERSLVSCNSIPARPPVVPTLPDTVAPYPGIDGAKLWSHALSTLIVVVPNVVLPSASCANTDSVRSVAQFHFPVAVYPIRRDRQAETTGRLRISSDPLMKIGAQ